MTEDGKVEIIQGKGHEFGYRKSIFHANKGVILSARIILKKGNQENILSIMKDLSEKRRDKQPLEMPSAGSVFKRPEGSYAGKLIMESGLKGKQIGGAMVSEKHAGFIVNTGNATAENVLNLMDYIREEVFKNFKIELMPEIKIVGE